MIVMYKGAFRRDATKISDRLVKKALREAIQHVKTASRLSQVPHLIKLRKYKIHYRIEIEGNYRIGLTIRNNKVWFVRVLNRSKIYKEFP